MSLLSRVRVRLVQVSMAIFALNCMAAHTPAANQPDYQKRSAQPASISGDPLADDEAFSTVFDDQTPGQQEKNASENQVQLSLNGYLETRNRFRLTDERFISTRQRLWLESAGKVFFDELSGNTAPLRSFLSAAIDYDPEGTRLSDDIDTVRSYFEEAYLTLDLPQFNLVLGRKMYRLGKGDGINPLDLINPLDHRDPIANGRSDSRLPVLLGAATVDLPISKIFQEASVDFIYVPRAEVNRLSAPGSPWEGPGLQALRDGAAAGFFSLEGQDEPDEYGREAEYLFRFSATLSGLDLALLGFSGYLDAPVFEGSIDAGVDEKLVVTPVHPSFSAFGINFAKGFARSTLRGELALKPDLPVMLNTSMQDFSFKRTAVVEGVLGLDRTLGTNFYINLQYFFTYTEDGDEFVGGTYDDGMTYDLHDLFFDDALEAGIRGIVSFSGQGGTFESYFSYEPADNWMIEVSALFFYGEEEKIYGQFDENDTLTLRIRYTF